MLNKILFIIALTGFLTFMSITTFAEEAKGKKVETKLSCTFDEENGKGKLVGKPVSCEGKKGKALSFDGKYDAVDFGSCHDLLTPENGLMIPEGRIEFWFAPKEDIEEGAHLSAIVDCSQSPRFAINPDGELVVSYLKGTQWSVANVCELKSGIKKWKADEWHKVLFSWDNAGHRLFVDETPVASDNVTGGVREGLHNLTIGAYFNGNSWSHHFAGKIDELLILTFPQSYDNSPQKLAGGLIREEQQFTGTITKRRIKYSVIYPENRTGLPVIFHQYGTESACTNSEKTNERLARDGIFCAFVSLSDSHCGYELQDYKDAIDDIYKRYGDRIDTGNVTIIGASYGGAVVYGMAARFPYLFSAAVPIFGIADFGYHETQSWYPAVLKNSPGWGPHISMTKEIGDREKYRETRYLVRNAILGAKNNPYAHFEILHDVGDGVNKPGVQVEQSRRYVAELKRLGYTNYNYEETPRADLVYPNDKRFPEALHGKQISYAHGFYSPNHPALHYFEIRTLIPNILKGSWKRPPFKTKGELFIPSYLEIPRFRIDLGEVANNCDEAVQLTYDISSPTKYNFQIVPLTKLTKGKFQLCQLHPNSRWIVTFKPSGEKQELTANADGSVKFDLPTLTKDAHLEIECIQQ